MKFTQRSFPRYALGLSTAFYRLGLSTVSKLVRFFFEGLGLMLYLLKLFDFHLSISAVVWCQLEWYTKFSGFSRTWVQILPLFISSFFSFKLKGFAIS